VIEGDVVADNLLLSGEWTTLVFMGNVTARNVLSEAASVVVLGDINVKELGMFALADTSLAVFGHAQVGILCAGNGVFEHSPMGWAGAFSAYGSLSVDALMGSAKGTKLTPKTPDRVVDLVEPSILSKADPTLLDVNQVDNAFRAGVPLMRNALGAATAVKAAKAAEPAKPAKATKAAKPR
jgi:hypothetical protein